MKLFMVSFVAFLERIEIRHVALRKLLRIGIGGFDEY